MTFSTTVSTTANDISVALDQRLSEVTKQLPDPAAQLARRFGAIWVEAVHQYGRVATVTIEVVEGILKVVSTGVSTVEGQTRALLEGTGTAARTVGETTIDVAKSAAADTADRMHEAGDDIRRSAEAAGDEISRRLRVVGGTADRVEDDVEAAVADGADRVVESIDDAVEASVDAGSGKPKGAYESWTKDELYERAQELDIEGRSSMNKRDLVQALRSA